MRKALYVLSLVVAGSSLFAQSIPNGGFENWTMQTLYSEPLGYNSSNPWVYQINMSPNVTQDAGAYHLNSAVRMTTISTQNDTTFGALIIGTAGPSGIGGGIPFTGQPDSISGYIRHSIQPNDTAFFIVAFKNNGNFIGMAVKIFTGIQSTYTRFSIPTNLPPSPAPDSIVAIFTSSRMDPPRIPGSTVTLDSITMIGSVQQFPNPSFETWVSTQREEPDNWTTINFGSSTANPSASKTTQAYSGTYALLLQSVLTNWGDTLAYITNGYFGNNGPEGGMAVYQNPMKVSGYYKYSPMPNDTAMAGAFTYINGIIIDSVMLKLNAAATYTYFEMNFTYNNWPLIDTLGIAFSANIPDISNSAPGSALFIDALQVSYFPLDVAEDPVLMQSALYPNPMAESAVVLLDKVLAAGTFEILDFAGRVIRRESVTNTHLIPVNRSGLAEGMYLYRVLGTKGEVLVSDRFLVLR